MTGTEWQIPDSTLQLLKRAPRDRPVAVLLRHSVRNALPPGAEGYALPITPAGQRLAQELGERLGARLRSLHSSPLVRCVQTVEALREGAGTSQPVVNDRLLGDPGAFVMDGDIAWQNWERLGHEGVMAHLVSGSSVLPGMARPDVAARFLVHHMMAVAGDEPGVHVFVTHDSLVTAAASRLLGCALGPADWPWYLEAAWFWRTDEGLRSAFRDQVGFRSEPLCSLSDVDVVELARREVAATVGLNCGARFFLAGGAFKTLISGRAPRDLDVWAPSERDRALLVRTLLDRGATQLERRAYSDAFQIAGRTVEVPDAVAPTTLSERLAQFDIALSAVGVEYRPNGTWGAEVHPLARESMRRRQVLLLKPLANWKYALATLERMRRYGSELGFEVPEEEEAEVWRVFDAQSDEMKVGMVDRFQRTGTGDFGVADEVRRRFPAIAAHATNSSAETRGTRQENPR